MVLKLWVVTVQPSPARLKTSYQFLLTRIKQHFESSRCTLSTSLLLWSAIFNLIPVYWDAEKIMGCCPRSRAISGVYSYGYKTGGVRVLKLFIWCYLRPFQAWLCDVERSMRWTLKELLKQCRLALKKNTSKRDKWVKEWAGQVNRSWYKCVDYWFIDATIYLHVRKVKIKEKQRLNMFES